MIRLALVGFGAWGRNYVGAARASGLAEVTQVVLREGSKTQVPDDLEVVSRIEDLSIDAAVVATHPSASSWIAQALLSAGYPVMVEKPAALSVADAEALAEVADASGLPFLVAHQHLFSERIEFLRGAHLAPLMVRWHGPTSHDYGYLWDYGPHGVSAVLALRGRMPDAVQLVHFTQNEYSLVLRYGKSRDRVCCIKHNKTATIHAETRLPSLDGSLLYDGYAPAEPPLTRAVRAFARAVEAGSTDDWRFGASWAVNVARVLSRGA